MSAREENLRIIKNLEGVERLETSYYSRIPSTNNDIYVSLKAGERLDILAHRYYGDSTLWWVIAQANNLLLPFNIDENIVLRIPPKNVIF